MESRQIIGFIEKRWLVLTIMLAVIIAFLSLLPPFFTGSAHHLPKWLLSHKLYYLLKSLSSDKLHHFIGYFLFALPIAIAKPRYWQFLLGLLLVYSGLIELVQPYVNRSCEWFDFTANSLGLLLGTLSGLLIVKIKD